MTIQTANLGAPPSGVGGDTFRTAATKFNENFTNNAHAASRYVGTAAGNVMEVGAFGVGAGPRGITVADYINNTDVVALGYDAGRVYPSGFVWRQVDRYLGALLGMDGEIYAYCRLNNNINNPTIYKARSTKNTTVDSNGFIKAASPIVKLFADKIELNNEAQLQDIAFEKLGTGDYLIKNSTGFSNDGWYVEAPKDANGNVLFSVIYTTLENGDISVKTYKKKFDLETASIVADMSSPVDIPAGRWIDIRLQELPQPEFVPPVSNTPASFQPTGIAQAVSEMMNGTEQ